MKPRFRSSIAAASIALVVVSTGSGCTVGLEDIPMPAPSIGDQSYTVHASFDNALNLPTAAKVRLAGADVGEVTGMTVRNYTAVVTMRLSRDVELPVGTRAELRTATPLGDVFVAMVPDPEAAADAPTLTDGATIALADTSAAATVEEVLTTAAMLVNGGAVRNLTKVVNDLGAAVGDRGDRLGGLITQTTELVRDLAARSGRIRTTLAHTDRLAVAMNERQNTIDDVLAASGPAIGVVGDNSQEIVDVVAQVDRISKQVAKFPSIQGTDTRSIVADMNTIADGLNRAATNPNADFDRFNEVLAPILKLTNGTSAHVNIDMADISVGAVPDPMHDADPEGRPPDARDWANFVGAFTYTMMKLHDRVMGPGQ